MFNANRNRVIMSRREGNTEKLTGCSMYIDDMRMTTDKVMSRVTNRSNIRGGSGMIMTAMMQTAAIGIIRCDHHASLKAVGIPDG